MHKNLVIDTHCHTKTNNLVAMTQFVIFDIRAMTGNMRINLKIYIVKLLLILVSFIITTNPLIF